MVQKSTPQRQHEFDIAYMKMAVAMSELSYAIRKQVGSIIVSKDDQVISQGFNGTAAGLPNVCEEVDNNGVIENHDNDMSYVQTMYRPIHMGKFTGMRLVTKDTVLHAEANAISKCARYDSSVKGGTLYVTLSPCIQCAKLIVQSEIVRVVYLNDYRDDSGIKFLKSCGIQVDKLIP